MSNLNNLGHLGIESTLRKAREPVQSGPGCFPVWVIGTDQGFILSDAMNIFLLSWFENQLGTQSLGINCLVCVVSVVADHVPD